MISLHEPDINQKDRQSVLKSMKTGWVSTAGKLVEKFENKISKLCKIKYVLATNSGTSSLFLALKVSGVSINDEVIVSTLTFIAPVNAITYNNSRPIFMDTDNFLNIDQDKTIQFLNECTIKKNGFTYNKKTKKKIKAIILVHTFGNLCNFDNLIIQCKKRNIITIEDSAESFGSYYLDGKFKNKYAGTIADIGCYSFNGNKIITTGAGGALVTNSKKYYLFANYLSNQAKDNSLFSIHNSIGYNLKMSNLAAALGCSQIDRIKFYIKKKKKIFDIYKKNLNNIQNLKIVEPPEYSSSNFWLIILIINFQNIKINKRKLINILNKSKIETRPIWKLNHLQKPYKSCQNFLIYNCHFYLNNAICLPSSSNLKYKEVKYICNTIKKYIN